MVDLRNEKLDKTRPTPTTQKAQGTARLETEAESKRFNVLPSL